MKDTLIHSRISANATQDRYEETQTLDHHRKEKPKDKGKILKADREKAVIVHREMMRWWRWENKARSSFEWLKKPTNVRERRGRRSGLLRTVRETNLCGVKGGDEQGAGCGGQGEGRQIRKPRQRSSTSNKGWGLSRSGRRRAPVSFFPNWTTSHLLRDAGGGARGMLPGSWPRPPGCLVQLISKPPRMDPKDGQCSLATQSAHHTLLQLPSVHLPLQFSSAQPVSCPGPSSPLSRPVQTISLGSKEVGVQVAFSLLLVPSRARASPASSPQNSACPASPISPMIGPVHHTLCSLPFQQFY